jgi:hypothetical protein
MAKDLMFSEIIREKHLDQPQVVISVAGGNLSLAPLDAVLKVADSIAPNEPVEPTHGATLHMGSETLANIVSQVRPGSIISLGVSDGYVRCTPYTAPPAMAEVIQKVLDLGCIVVNLSD